MTTFNLVVVENDKTICLGNDVTNVSISNNELTYVYDNDECVAVHTLDKTDSVVIKIDR